MGPWKLSFLCVSRSGGVLLCRHRCNERDWAWWHKRRRHDDGGSLKICLREDVVVLPVSVNKTLLLREPWPCNPVAKTSILPRFGALNTEISTHYSPEECVFHRHRYDECYCALIVHSNACLNYIIVLKCHHIMLYCIIVSCHIITHASCQEGHGTLGYEEFCAAVARACHNEITLAHYPQMSPPAPAITAPVWCIFLGGA